MVYVNKVPHEHEYYTNGLMNMTKIENLSISSNSLNVFHLFVI